MKIYPTLKEIHFVGIGGIGMSGLAEILLTMGCRVTGSDLKRSPLTDRLRRRGARIRFGHRAENVEGPQVVVVSTAVARSNPEVASALKQGIPVIARGEMLAELMRLKYGIAVAGSHGKTTTTSLVASVLDAGGFDPTVVIGGRVKSLRSNARLGRGDYLVAEADESDGSFLHLSPTIAVVTNVDREHMDHYRDFESLRNTFAEFIAKIPFYGAAILCADHPESARLAAGFAKRAITYGLEPKGRRESGFAGSRSGGSGGAGGPPAMTPDYQAKRIRLQSWESEFDVRYRGELLGRVRLRHPGMHNVLNSLAAVAVGRELGMRFSDIRKALGKFRGIGRRLEKIHDNHLLIVDDYGHHPEEIRATLNAMRQVVGKRRLWVLFQPHRFTRTKDLFEEFSNSFGEADQVVLTNIYAASEEPIRGVTAQALAEAIGKKTKKTVRFIPRVGEIADAILPDLKKGDVVLTLGAGDIWKAGKELAGKING